MTIDTVCKLYWYGPVPLEAELEGGKTMISKIVKCFPWGGEREGSLSGS